MKPSGSQRRSGWSALGPPSVLLLGLLLCASAGAQAPELALPAAVREALTSNLDLVARRQDLEAARQEIGLARSKLLPQVGAGARAQFIEDDRSDSKRGNNEATSYLVAAGLNQVVYDEDSWAGFTIQKHAYDSQSQQLEAFRLGVIQDAADAFLELDRSVQVLEIQRRNRETTRENLETSRARIAAGWSSEREILRWQSQLAINDTDVRAAEATVLRSRFALNRIRNVSPESPASVTPATIGEYGFAYARDAIAKAVAEPDVDRRMRDFFVRVGLRRSPDLAALDASIAASERQLTARRRAFWLPSLSLSAGIDHLTNQSSGADFDETEWLVKGELFFPIFQGGAKLAGRDQAIAALASLRTQRLSSAQSVEEGVRSTLAVATASYEGVGFTTRQVTAARRNEELVDASYELGVASILDVLDAQSQLLTAELSLTNATYGFLEDLIAAERQISFYPFLETPADADALLDQLAGGLGVQP